MKKPAAEDIEALLRIFEASDYTEMHFEAEGFELLLSDDADADAIAGPVSGRQTRFAQSTAASSSVSDIVPPSDIAPPPDIVPLRTSEKDDERGLFALTAPSLGHFYRSPKPGEPPFVAIGQHVGVHDVVCVIEVMKLFTLLEAGQSGIVRRICVEDGALVEFEQPLMYLELST